ncbi:hypothetical protein PMAYCL1PPCAC_24082, partial [Pristionchus mayeri]
PPPPPPASHWHQLVRPSRFLVPNPLVQLEKPSDALFPPQLENTKESSEVSLSLHLTRVSRPRPPLDTEYLYDDDLPVVSSNEKE